MTWLTDLSHNPRRFQEIINNYEALLYLRDDEEDDVSTGAAEVVSEHTLQPAMVMNGVVREPTQPDAMRRRTDGGVVGAGGGLLSLNEATMDFLVPTIRPGDT